ncbi:low molecular weight protein tyrosine phosphatase family protein [Brevundimonas sp.]|uniref:low molecular weight protein tyrosine phosphatase family protein n=1 Tax=Brevundimonas sp. TaxID=1871086 RepID=UPI002FC88704
MTNLLFLCSRNRLRSPTAEQVFGSRPGVETASAGLAPDAEEACSVELVEWADIIFVMERVHRARLQRRFRAHLKRARVICLDIPDDYAFMQPELVALLEKKVGPLL